MTSKDCSHKKHKLPWKTQVTVNNITIFFLQEQHEFCWASLSLRPSLPLTTLLPWGWVCPGCRWTSSARPCPTQIWRPEQVFFFEKKKCWQNINKWLMNSFSFVNKILCCNLILPVIVIQANYTTCSRVTLGSWDFPVGKSSTTLCGSPAMFTRLYSPL